jgi:transketolase N-terminal domain/subunit
MAKKITILVDEDGNAKLEGHGFIGIECDRAMQEISQALGERTQVQHKPEYRQVQQNRQVQRGGR